MIEIKVDRRTDDEETECFTVRGASYPAISTDQIREWAWRLPGATNEELREITRAMLEATRPAHVADGRLSVSRHALVYALGDPREIVRHGLTRPVCDVAASLASGDLHDTVRAAL